MSINLDQKQFRRSIHQQSLSQESLPLSLIAMEDFPNDGDDDKNSAPVTYSPSGPELGAITEPRDNEHAEDGKEQQHQRQSLQVRAPGSDSKGHNRSPINIKYLQQAFCALPGILMVILFGYSYVAVVTFGNDNLFPHAGFFLGWAQISNIAITLSAGIMGDTKWAIGGANTTSAILLADLLQNSNLETALTLQGVLSLLVALAFIVSAMCGGIGRLLGDKNPGTELYADYIHPSLIMALSHATALYMVKYSLEIANEGIQLNFDDEWIWWKDVFSLEALSIWIPAWVIGGGSAFLDMRLQKHRLAMGLLLGLPLITFIIAVRSVGLEHIPHQFYWEFTSALEPVKNIDFSLIDGVEVAKKLPISFVSALVIYTEALCVYKSYPTVIAEIKSRSVKADTMSCGVAHILIAACGGWIGHQSFVESFVIYRLGFRWNHLGGLVELASFGAFAGMVFALETPPPFPTILLSAITFYLAFVMVDIWFLKRLPPATTVLEWILSSAVLACILVFGFTKGLGIGFLFLTISVYATKTYDGIVKGTPDYDPSSGEMEITLHRHIACGNTTEIFDLILEASKKPSTVLLNMMQVSSSDSALSLFFDDIVLMIKLESIRFKIRHSFLKDSSAVKILEEAAEVSDGMLEYIFVDVDV